MSNGIVILNIERVMANEKVCPVVTVNMFGKEIMTTAKGQSSREWEFNEQLILLVDDPYKDWVLIQLHDYRYNTIIHLCIS